MNGLLYSPANMLMHAVDRSRAVRKWAWLPSASASQMSKQALFVFANHALQRHLNVVNKIFEIPWLGPLIVAGPLCLAALF